MDSSGVEAFVEKTDIRKGLVTWVRRPSSRIDRRNTQVGASIPKHGDIVLLGGAEGLVVGGTGQYRNARGPYSTRLKVETIGGFFA
jgi:hypothetical protein